MQALSRLALDPIAETVGDPHSYGFRTQRSPADAIEPCGNALARQHAPPWMLAGDIRACCDGISPDWFLAPIPRETAMLQQWLQAGGMETQVRSPTATGVPQGGIASPVMANLALDGRAKRRKAHSPPHPQRAQRAKVHRIRSGDDCSMTGSSYHLLAHAGKPLVVQLLGERGLERSPTQPPLTSREDGVDFLGQHLRTDAGTRRITPARKQRQRCLGHIRDMVQAHTHTTAGKLMAHRNPGMRGWAHSHRHVVRKATFITVETAIFRSLWSWATRRHPKKSGRWGAKQYVRTPNGRPWPFVGTGAGHQGPPYALALCRAGDVRMQRQVKITGPANPYDPQWAVDCEERLGVQMAHPLTGRRHLLSLWKHPHGLCPVCPQKITRRTGWHNHHVVWRTHGGRETADNRVLLHPNGHRQVHSPQFDVAPSRSARSVCKA